MPGYYDYVLGLIPVTLFGATGSLTWLGLSFTAALPIAAVIALGIIAHAMFVRAPVPTAAGRGGRDVGTGDDAPYPNAD